MSCTIPWSVEVALAADKPRSWGLRSTQNGGLGRAGVRSEGGAPAPLLTRHRAQGGLGVGDLLRAAGPERRRRAADGLGTRLPRLALVLPAPPDSRVVVPPDRRVREPARDRGGDGAVACRSRGDSPAQTAAPGPHAARCGAGRRHRGPNRARRPRRALQAQPVSRRPSLRADDRDPRRRDRAVPPLR